MHFKLTAQDKFCILFGYEIITTMYCVYNYTQKSKKCDYHYTAPPLLLEADKALSQQPLTAFVAIWYGALPLVHSLQPFIIGWQLQVKNLTLDHSFSRFICCDQRLNLFNFIL